MKISNIEITNPEKILFPKDKITKAEFVRYYEKIAPKMLPFLKDRMIAMERFPDGINKEGFYQKDASDYFPKFVKTKKEGGNDYVIVNNKESLVYLAGQAVVVFHVWMSRADKIEKPDKIVFDIDPPNDKNYDEVCKAAAALKKILEHLGLKSFPLFSGSKGIHVTVPIKRELKFKDVKEFARRVAAVLVNLNPKKYTLEIRKNARKGRILIDVLRNEKAQLAVAPYSVRAKNGAPIAVPLSWTSLKDKDYSIRKLPAGNAWKDYFKVEGDVRRAIKRVGELER